MKPVLQLTTADGAIFENSDQLSVALVDTSPLRSTVLEWKVPPLHQRYLEACAQVKVGKHFESLRCTICRRNNSSHFSLDADNFLQSQLELIASTQSLTIHDQIIAPKLSRPMFRSIHFQSNLSTIDLSNCFLEDEGIKQLSQALPTIGQLSSLLLGGNLITSIGIRYLCAIFDAENDEILPELSTLDFSFNPLQDQSISPLAKFCRQLRQLKSLNLASTDLTDLQEYDLSYGSLAELNLSLNKLTIEGVVRAIGRLNSCKLTKIDFSYCLACVEGNSYSFVDSIVKMLSNGTCANLEEIRLDGCRLGDTDCWRLTQALLRSKALRTLSLRDNIQLTKITWKFLLENVHINTLMLEGCHALVADLNTNEVDNVQANHCTENIFLSLTQCSSDKDNEIDLLQRQWSRISQTNGHLFRNKSRIWLTTQPENVPLSEWEVCV